eukprot:10829374-Karenia_brevis.AAC.1
MHLLGVTKPLPGVNAKADMGSEITIRPSPEFENGHFQQFDEFNSERDRPFCQSLPTETIVSHASQHSSVRHQICVKSAALWKKRKAS